MEPKELRSLTPEELEQKKRELAQELFNLKLRNAMGQIENPMQIRRIRRDLARVETVKAERRHATKEGAAP